MSGVISAALPGVSWPRGAEVSEAMHKRTVYAVVVEAVIFAGKKWCKSRCTYSILPVGQDSVLRQSEWLFPHPISYRGKAISSNVHYSLFHATMGGFHSFQPWVSPQNILLLFLWHLSHVFRCNFRSSAFRQSASVLDVFIEWLEKRNHRKVFTRESPGKIFQSISLFDYLSLSFSLMIIILKSLFSAIVVLMIFFFRSNWIGCKSAVHWTAVKLKQYH